MDGTVKSERGLAATIGVGIVAVVVLLAIVLAVIIASWSAIKVVSRYQARADASNRVKVTATQVRNVEQRKRVEQQQAEIRLIQATGVRHAQDEIAKTLTPLYVQFEMVEAMKAIAQSGKNNTVVYIPAGANGIPLVQGAGPSVGLPDDD